MGADAGETMAEQHTGDPESRDEETVHTAFEQAVSEGVERLHRSWASLLSTGAVGGIDLGFGVLGLLIVRNATGSRLLGALAFSIGFIALILARSELFTENFLVPITAVVTHNARWSAVARLWAGTAVTNLLGGWVMMGLVIWAVPRLHEAAVVIETGEHYPDLGIGATTLASAILAGATMTLMTWMERGTRSMLGKLTAAVVTAFLLAGTPMLHSIVTSLEMFAALHVGAPFGYLDWLGVFAWSVLGNLIGGVGLITTLRLVQVGRRKVDEERARPSHQAAA